VLAVLSIIGGWIQWAPLWHPISNWLDPVAPPLAVPTDTQEALASLFAVLLGLAGIGVAWLIYGARQPTAPRITSRVPLWSRSLLEHKFYFDEAYDFALYRPSVALAKALGRWIEGPIIGGSIRELVAGIRDAAVGTSRLQTGLVRSYALAIAASLAVITIVFVAVR